jgi:hypothetical protein
MLISPSLPLKLSDAKTTQKLNNKTLFYGGIEAGVAIEPCTVRGTIPVL